MSPPIGQTQKSKQPVRIAVDARPLAVPMFGIGRYTSLVIERLFAKSGVQWFLYSDRPLPVGKYDHSHTVVRACASHRRLLAPWRSQVQFSRWARQDDVDVFWSPRHHLPLLLPQSVRRVLTIHDLVWLKHRESMQKANYWLERLLMPPSLQAADRLLAVSHATAADLVAFNPETSSKISVTPLAADLMPDAGPDIRIVEGRYILFVGTLEPRKNLRVTLKAWASIASDVPEVQFVIAGAQGWMSDIHDIVKEEGATRVRVLGRVTDAELGTLYHNAIVTLMPSLYEGFGLPALESMTYGTPVIGSNVSSLPEVIGDGGLLVDPHSIGEIASSIREIVTNQRLRADLSRSALRQAASFSWQKTADATFNALIGLQN